MQAIRPPYFLAALCWTLEQTADNVLVTPATIAWWIKRVDDERANTLVQLRKLLKQCPDFFRKMVQRLKNLNPSMGKVKIAETLRWAELHLAGL